MTAKKPKAQRSRKTGIVARAFARMIAAREQEAGRLIDTYLRDHNATPL